jgi:hypothetical protein
MNDLDANAFASLFKEAYLKSFGHPMANPLSETESKLFSTRILDQTGLVIGAKSIKNYSFYIFNGAEGKEENPSVATLDTLARFVLNAPYTDEIQRKNKESHYPYWFQYKDHYYRSLQQSPAKKKIALPLLATTGIIVLIVLVVFGFFLFRAQRPEPFTEEFHSVEEDSLFRRGWIVQSKESTWWDKRGEFPEHLTLFTLKGDNWPDSSATPGITNLLLRKINADCFTMEIRLADFFPTQNWQQAGILLMEDTVFSGKSVRLSIAYNDYFGGFSEKPQIILQAITSLGRGSKPEEVTHKKLFTLDSVQAGLVGNNLKNSALRIEKSGRMIRFLHAGGPFENAAFQEAGSKEFPILVKYIGIFALKGQVVDAAVIPVRINSFSFMPEKCGE